jgi:uncharacterized protein (TIGR03435 family)
MIRSLVFLTCVVGWAQTATFEVASIKTAVITPGRRMTPLTGGPGTAIPTRLSGTASMKELLIRAYGVKSYQVSGPAWMDTELYEIAATIAPGATKEQAAEMMRNLLIDRFHLAAHRETKEMPIYALLLGKNGPKLQPADPVVAEADEKALVGGFVRPKVTMGPDGFPQIPLDARIPGTFSIALSSGEFLRTKVYGRNRDMDQVAGMIAQSVKRPVVNQTGLAGKYDFTLAYESDPIEGLGEPRRSAPENPGPTIFAAVQEQLGLKLESRKGPVEMVVVDRADRVPTEN